MSLSLVQSNMEFHKALFWICCFISCHFANYYILFRNLLSPVVGAIGQSTSSKTGFCVKKKNEKMCQFVFPITVTGI